MKTKTGAFLSVGRIPQLIGHTAVAAGLLAGGASLLNAGGAKAASCPGVTFPNPDYTQISTPATVTGVCVSLSPNEIDISNAFSPILGTNQSGFLTYSITASPGEHWIAVELDSTHQGSGVSVTKELFSDSLFTNKIIPSLVSDEGFPDGPDPIPNTYSTIYVKDSYTTGPSGQLVSINNEFRQTPGPLPILGAGAAFGFSRKLRSRIKAARLG
jgi:hypothetical protein